jgi:CMP-N-acetylneuraminic acid synthetase
VYVNTDSEKLFQELVSYSHVIPIRRSAQHIEWERRANDFGSPAMDMVREYCEQYLNDNEYFAIVHVTSPVLKSITLEKAFMVFDKERCHSVHSVKKIQDFIMSNARNTVTPKNFTFNLVSRTQDLDPLYQSLGAFFVVNSAKLKNSNYQRLLPNSILYPISAVEAIEIDQEDDLELARLVANSIKGELK